MDNLGMKGGAILTALGVLIAAVDSMLTAPNLVSGFAFEFAGAISAWAIAVQLKASKPYVLLIDPSDWQPRDDGGFVIVIPARRHRKGLHADPRLEFIAEEGSFEPVFTDVRVWPNGDIGVVVGGPQGCQGGRIVIV